MKKLITTIDDITEDVYIHKDGITLKNNKFTISKENGNYKILDANGKSTNIDDIIELGNNIIRIEIEGYTIDVSIEDPLLSAVSGVDDGDLNIVSPLAGSVSSILIKEGQTVEKGDIVLTISAMKMENKIVAKSAGIVKCVNVTEGEQVTKGAILIELDK